jgi:hypothetical protein
MSKITKIVLLVAVLNGIVLTTMADKGVGKNKKKTSVSIASVNSYSKTLSFSLKSGLKYTGSLLNNVGTVKNSLMYSNLVTYQKGNIIYIVPYKQRIVIPDIQQRYTGVKLIIKPKL